MNNPKSPARGQPNRRGGRYQRAREWTSSNSSRLPPPGPQPQESQIPDPPRMESNNTPKTPSRPATASFTVENSKLKSAQGSAVKPLTQPTKLITYASVVVLKPGLIEVTPEIKSMLLEPAGGSQSETPKARSEPVKAFPLPSSVPQTPPAKVPATTRNQRALCSNTLSLDSSEKEPSRSQTSGTSSQRAVAVALLPQTTTMAPSPYPNPPRNMASIAGNNTPRTSPVSMEKSERPQSGRSVKEAPSADSFTKNSEYQRRPSSGKGNHYGTTYYGGKYSDNQDYYSYEKQYHPAQQSYRGRHRGRGRGQNGRSHQGPWQGQSQQPAGSPPKKQETLRTVPEIKTPDALVVKLSADGPTGAAVPEKLPVVEEEPASDKVVEALPEIVQPTLPEQTVEDQNTTSDAIVVPEGSEKPQDAEPVISPVCDVPVTPRPLKRRCYQFNFLETAWTLYHMNGATRKKGTDWNAGIQTIGIFDTVEDFFVGLKSTPNPSETGRYQDYMLFRGGKGRRINTPVIRAAWEDKQNAEGGMWRFVLPVRGKGSAVVDDFWNEIMMALVGEQFGVCNEDVNGCYFCNRGDEYRLQIWMATTKEDAVIAVGTKIAELLNLVDRRLDFDFSSHKEMNNRGNRYAGSLHTSDEIYRLMARRTAVAPA